jgi:hypothetical protein
MRRLCVLLAAACIFTASAAPAQVTGIRHSDGSWTFVDAKGRDIHKDYHAPQAARDGKRRNSQRTLRDWEAHRVGGYLPWQAR